MRIHYLPIILLLATCTQVSSDKINTADTVFAKAKSFTTDKFEKSSILGDTINQRLEFQVGEDKFEFEIVYLILDPYEFSPAQYNKRIIEFKPIKLPSSFSKTMLNKLREAFWLHYHIPVNNFDSVILPGITDKHISEFFKIHDYNLDGISDIGISDTPTGNNVFEDIFVKFDNEFVFWKGLSGRPIWSVDQGKRTITTGWHMSADVHSESTLRITQDTTLTEILREDIEELDEARLIRRIYEYSVLIRVDTIFKM